jgi:hypothetical protein
MTVPAHIIAICQRLRTCPKVVAECWNKLPGGKPHARIVTDQVMDLTDYVMSLAGPEETKPQSRPARKPRT